ncbi:hypothetical protein SAMN05421788_107237 [Filimonas lacunae]|uniref:Uncharacterized protein n=1 Tax=Filimonas lacunae TaxID=477680 RepID=A0A173MG19_9BACT|nr:hypothetical protein FLA_2593 [Filimonas lacunae]SIT27444.1 hypothetical protein SAMN05421788_107237 [Filimonas lacunae]
MFTEQPISSEENICFPELSGNFLAQSGSFLIQKGYFLIKSGSFLFR